MKFLNVSGEQLDSPHFLNATNAELGAWLRLASWCAGQENGGILCACRGWGARVWAGLGLDPADVASDTPLWHWEGDDLHLHGYPASAEEALRKKREGGKNGGRPPKNPAPSAPKNHAGNHMVSDTKTMPETEKEREGKREREEKGKGSHSDDPTDDEFSLSTLAQTLQFAAAHDIPADCATAWHLRHSTRGWADDEGQPIRSRTAALRGWAVGWRKKNRAAPALSLAPVPSAPSEPEGWRPLALEAGYSIDPDVPWLSLPPEARDIALSLVAQKKSAA